MKGSHLIREARRRAALSQQQLAEIVGTTQSAIARIESGRHSPTVQRLSDIAEACGFDIQIRLIAHDDHDWTLVSHRRSRTPEQRVDDLTAMVDLIGEGRAAMLEARRTRPGQQGG